MSSKRNTFTLQHKLDAVNFAENNSLGKAASHFGSDGDDDINE
jgi:hypothetical protein